MSNMKKTLLAACIFLGLIGSQASGFGAPGQVPLGEGASSATGVVFHDRNGNGSRDAGERGLRGVGVSNGEHVAVTGPHGQYTLPVTDDTIIFVIKPSGWMTSVDPVTQLPKFFYIHKPNGSPALKYGGVPPTGPLPASVDFPLLRVKEPDRFTMLCFGDTQPRDQQEVDFIAHDIVEEVAGEDILFGTTLGDLVFDDLRVMEPLTRAIGLIGAPWYHVIGNHDHNYDAPAPEQADETYERVFGPSYYSFNYGKVHFIALNNISWDVNKKEYHGELGAKQRAFIEADLQLVPKDRLVVLMMHIPFHDVQDRKELFALLKPFPHTFSLAAHWHTQEHFFLDAGDDWQGALPHHHVVHATACGSWWGGQFDEVGIPHAVMADGAPNGYSFITFDGNEYLMRFKAPRRPATYQMDIHAPEAVSSNEAAQTDVIVNVFAGSSRSKVEIRLGASPSWQPMERFTGTAPLRSLLDERQKVFAAKISAARGIENPSDQDLRAIEQEFRFVFGRGLPKPKSDTGHLWRAKLPANPPAGSHFIHVRTTDMFGQVYEARRVIRIE